jgi:hypothetical protein
MLIKLLDLTQNNGYAFQLDQKNNFPLVGSTDVELYLRSHMAIVHRDPLLIREVFSPAKPESFFTVKDVISW